MMHRMLIATAMLALPASLAAHTAMKSSAPASGSVLTSAPPTLTLNFNQPTQMTAMTLVSTAGEQALAFTPSGSARSFAVARPALKPGRNAVRWRALSRDGHIVEGQIILVLRAPVP